MVDKEKAIQTGNASRHWLISGIVLAIFFSALLYDYWPALVPAALRMFNSARAVGATTTESRFFEVRNSSDASPDQVQPVVTELEKQYQAISAYTHTKPAGRLPLLIVNGQGPAVIDGSELVINNDNGSMDTRLAPIFLAVLIEDLKIDPAGAIVPPGGQALQVVEAAGLGGDLIRQPLDAWTVLLRQSQAYLPLEQAWKAEMPNDDDGYYNLMRALLESGSFMRWLTAKYGLDAAQQIARGASIESVTGKSLKENEAEWLKALDGRKIKPQPCETVIPEGSMFRLICEKLHKVSH